MAHLRGNRKAGTVRMNSLDNIVAGLAVFKRYGATSVEAEHDQIYVTTDSEPDDLDKLFLEDWGWELVEDSINYDEANLLWYTYTL